MLLEDKGLILLKVENFIVENNVLNEGMLNAKQTITDLQFVSNDL